MEQVFKRHLIIVNSNIKYIDAELPSVHPQLIKASESPGDIKVMVILSLSR